MLNRTRMGPWGVEATAHRLADIHGALLCSVDALGAWIAVVPELETKMRWAYDLYDLASLADAVGRRIHALTAERPQVPRPANRSLLRFLQELVRLDTPGEQISGLYHVLIPALLESCRDHLSRTNPVADEPTLRIMHGADGTLENMVIWAAKQAGDSATTRRMHLYLTEAGGLHGPGAPFDGEANLRPTIPQLPLRDERFIWLQPGKRMPKSKPLQTPEGRIRLLHIALINLEIPAIEVCGRMIAEYPEVPWELKLDLAAQIWDEARHAELCADRLTELGGHVGQFPYHHRVWDHSVAGETLAERFVTTQRLHEGNGLDQTLLARDLLAEIGDLPTSQIMDYIMADEVIHVRNGNKWIEWFLPDPESRDALYRMVEERLGPAALAGPPINRGGRRKAGFTEIELDFLADYRGKRG